MSEADPCQYTHHFVLFTKFSFPIRGWGAVEVPALFQPCKTRKCSCLKKFSFSICTTYWRNTSFERKNTQRKHRGNKMAKLWQDCHSTWSHQASYNARNARYDWASTNEKKLDVVRMNGSVEDFSIMFDKLWACDTNLITTALLDTLWKTGITGQKHQYCTIDYGRSDREFSGSKYICQKEMGHHIT